jgi:protein-disulfide isomerase
MNRSITITFCLAVTGIAALASVRPDRRDGSRAVFVQDTQNLFIAQRSKGSPAAPITVFEMSDFQCPFCRRHAMETFPELERLYVTTGKVRWIFVNFPIPQLHANATAAAEFAMCAAKANRFWPIHDLIFKHQDAWKSLPDPGPFLLGLADSVGLARRTLIPCLVNGEMRQLVRQEAEEVARVGIQSTPSFVIEGKLLRGAAPLEAFRGILDSIYTAKLQAPGRP